MADAYDQEETNIYWLGVQHYVTLPGKFGWKSTDPSLQWNDNAVRQTAAGWVPLEYPSDHLFAGQPLDLAFVINGTSIPTLTTPPWYFTPITLNLASRGRWISAHVEPPEGYDAEDIIVDSVMMEDTIPADRGQVTGKKLLLKFDRSELEDMVLGSPPPLKPAEFKISGRLADGTRFVGYSNPVTFTGLE